MTSDRIKLTKKQQTEFQRRRLVDQALALFIEGSKTMPDIAKELNLDLKDLHRFSISDSYPEFKQALAAKAVDMYLDVQQYWTIEQIAEVLGMTKRQLQLFTHSDEFKDRYDEIKAILQDNPAPMAVHVKMAEQALPLAMKSLMDELSENSPLYIRQAARRDVFKMLGIEPIRQRDSDKKEAAQFLAEQQNFFLVNVPQIPEEFQQALVDYLPGEYTLVEDESGDTLSDHTLPETSEADKSQE